MAHATCSMTGLETLHLVQGQAVQREPSSNSPRRRREAEPRSRLPATRSTAQAVRLLPEQADRVGRVVQPRSVVGLGPPWSHTPAQTAESYPSATPASRPHTRVCDGTGVTNCDGALDPAATTGFRVADVGGDVVETEMPRPWRVHGCSSAAGVIASVGVAGGAHDVPGLDVAPLGYRLGGDSARREIDAASSILRPEATGSRYVTGGSHA